MATLGYELYDVFARRPYGGNPLAVFLDPPPLTTAAMQTVAAELNLSESVFVTPTERADCDLRLRIFTPRMELPMAGHPTVGTAFALAAAGRIESGEGAGEITFEEGVGPVRVRVAIAVDGPERAVMEQPVPEIGPAPVSRSQAAALLAVEEDDLAPGTEPFRGSGGVPFLYLELKDLEAVGRVSLRTDFWSSLLAESSAPHLIVFCRQTAGADADVHVRMFAPAMGIGEDPATGAAAGPLGAWLTTTSGGAGPASWVIEQGLEMGRPSRIEVEVEAADGIVSAVGVGGGAVRVGEGTLVAPEREPAE